MDSLQRPQESHGRGFAVQVRRRQPNRGSELGRGKSLGSWMILMRRNGTHIPGEPGGSQRDAQSKKEPQGLLKLPDPDPLLPQLHRAGPEVAGNPSHTAEECEVVPRPSPFSLGSCKPSPSTLQDSVPSGPWDHPALQLQGQKHGLALSKTSGQAWAPANTPDEDQCASPSNPGEHQSQIGKSA